MSTVLTTKSMFAREDVQAKFKEILGKRAPAFITSVLQIAASNDQLSVAEPMSIYNAAATAASLDLPLNNGLGLAYIVPFKKGDKSFAQFQIGYKGFIQLAHRSGQFLSLSATHITDKDKIKGDRLLGHTFEFSETPGVIVGYVAHFKLINGFEKAIYMTNEELKTHGIRFSQTFKKGFGLWKEDFDSMALKTVTKRLLTKWAPLSIDMQTALITDQAVINNEDATDVTYPDNEPLKVLPVLEIGTGNFDGCRNAIKTGEVEIGELYSKYEISEDVHKALLS